MFAIEWPSGATGATEEALRHRKTVCDHEATAALLWLLNVAELYVFCIFHMLIADGFTI